MIFFQDWPEDVLNLVRDICRDEPLVDAELVSSKLQNASFGANEALLFRVEASIDRPADGVNGIDFWESIAEEIESEFNYDIQVLIRDGYDQLGAGFEATWIGEGIYR